MRPCAQGTRLPARARAPGDPARSGAPPIPRAPAARAPVHPLPPGSCPASSLSTHLPCSALHPDAAHLSFVRGGITGTFRDCPLCARRCAKPGLVQSSQTLRGKRLTAPLPRLSEVWPFAQGHADLNTHPDGSHLATEPQRLPFTSVTTLGPPNYSGGKNNHTGGWHRDAPTVCQTFSASFHLPEAQGIYHSHLTGEERDTEK